MKVLDEKSQDQQSILKGVQISGICSGDVVS